MRLIQQIATIASSTYKEAIRQPIYVVLLFLTLGSIAISPALASYTLEDDNKLLTDLCLSTLFVGGLFLAAFLSAGAIHEEIERKTVLTIVSKPVSRAAFIIGKYIGLLQTLLSAFCIWCLTFLIVSRHKVIMRASDQFDEPVLALGFGAVALAIGLSLMQNYFHNKAFGSMLTRWLLALLALALIFIYCLSPDWEWKSPTEEFKPQLWTAMLLVFEAIAVLAAIAVACSTRWGKVFTLSLCIGFFLAGLMSDYFLGSLIHKNIFAKIAYNLLPNLQYSWLADALAQNHEIPLSYLADVSIYNSLYALAILCIGMFLFQGRDVG